MSSTADPTGTKTLREREFRPALTRRFRALKSAIRTTVGYDNDALRLRTASPTDRSGQALFGSQTLQADVDDIDDAQRFEFATDAQAVDAFSDWLETQIDRGVLERLPRSRVRNGEHYTASYIRASYDRGYQDAARRLRERGIDVSAEDLEVTFNRGVAGEQLQTLYTRTFNELEGITDATQQTVRRELAGGLAEGVNPRVMARRLGGRVDAIGITRAETLARTEVLRSYNSAALDRYQRAGISGVTAEVEHLTAGDARVCPKCRSLSGTRYTLDEARGRLPIHPSCRCAWSPVV